jgi:hypothetical protein
MWTHSVPHIGGRTIWCYTGAQIHPPDFDEPFDPDSFSEKLWAKVPELIRKDVEQHVAAKLPADVLAKLRDLHARGIPIGSDPAFFHFGGGMAIRNLCGDRLSDEDSGSLLPLRRRLGRVLYRCPRRNGCGVAGEKVAGAGLPTTAATPVQLH